MRRPDPDIPVWRDGDWIDGREHPAAVAPWAQWGLGAFETVGVRDGRPLDAAAHVGRLAETCCVWSIGCPEPGVLVRVVGELAGRIPGPAGWVKVVVHREGPCAAFAGRATSPGIEEARTAIVLPWRRHADDPTVPVKLTSRAWAAAGLEAARAAGADEGLWRNHRGHVTEACTANLFLVQGRKVFTATPRDGAFPGIVRGHALAAARALGLAVHEGKVRRTRLRDADEAFLTSAVAGVRPLVRIDGREIGAGGAGRWTVRIAEGVERRRLEAVAASKSRPDTAGIES